MSSATVRIGLGARKILRDLAGRSGKSMQDVLEDAIERYRREAFLRDVNAAYGTLRRDPKSWDREERERALWDVTLPDGLDPAETWTDDGKPARRPRSQSRRRTSEK